jgi:serine/threonine-protein kinase
MAEVHDGWDTRLARPVAIKILHPGFDSEPESRRRFETEARAAAALNNPHIVAVHDSGEHNGMPFIVMERLTGESLHDKIARGPLPQPLVRSVLDGVLAALAAAHQSGILHRDIKPANILFTSSGEAKVSDFGVAKMADSSRTAAGQVFGTTAYLSPDRVLGKPATVADDVYAVGVVGYEALTGRRAFPQHNIVALAQAILHDQLPRVGVLRPDVDPALAAAVERAMARDPRMRFPSAGAMREALVGRPQPGSAPPGTRLLDAPLPPMSFGPFAVPRGPTRRNKQLALAAVIAALLLALILIVFDSPLASAPQPANTTTTTSVVPTTTAISTAPTTMAPPAPAPPGHKPGKHGNSDYGNSGDGD